jgi:DNA-binding transcriptional LysR family regulator
VTHFTPAEAIRLMDEGGVDAAVIHPPALDPNSTALALQAVRDYPRRFAIMGAHDLLFQPPNGSSGARACENVVT